MFTGQDPELHTYRSRAHLAEMISLLGTPPPELIARAELAHKFFTKEGKFATPDIVPPKATLEERETSLSGEDKEEFLRFMARMLQWEPEKRSSAAELANDDWILKQLKQK